MGGLKLVGIDHLSPSGANTLQGCERQFVARYGPEKFFDPPTEATAIGGGFAHALEFGSLQLGLAEYMLRRPVADPTFSDPAAEERKVMIAEAIITHAHALYLSRFGDGTGDEREITFLVTLPGCDRVLQVRVDGYNHRGGYLIEDKLRSGSSLQPATVENEVRQGKQLSAEIYGHWKKTGRIIPVKYRLLRKPDPRTVKSIPLDEIDGVVAAHFATDKAIAEYTVQRTQAQLLEWEGEMVEMAQKADRLLRGDQRPVRNPSACHAYGRTCPMLARCQGITA